MIASENVASPLVREFMGSEIQNRYANYEKEDPRLRKYQGNQYMRDIELDGIEVAKKLFGAKFVELRPVSGTIADLAVILGFTRRGGLIMELEEKYGGHDTSGRFALCETANYRTLGFPFEEKDMNISTDEACKAIESNRPELLILGASVLLFPQPVKELTKSAKKVGATVSYDASHVLGLIAGGAFQDPFKEGADIIMGSTHKTFPGPQGGIILAIEEGEMAKKIVRGLHPPLITNHHPQRMPGMAIALLEMMAFGKEYASRIISNAQTLGKALYEQGVKVLGSGNGFTKSHTLILDATKFGGGQQAAATLERAGIITSKINLFGNPSYVRIGVQELTRIGMQKVEMETIATMYAETLYAKRKPENIAGEVTKLKKDFSTIQFTFETNKDPYQIIKT